MKALFFLLALLGSCPLWAQVNFSAQKQILIQGKSCQELQGHARSILEWTSLLNRNTLQMPECFCSSQSCQMDVAPISPYLVKELTNYSVGFNLETAYAGPNCFNAALAFNQTLNQITFTHPLEMTEILNSSLCTEIPLSEPLTPGDILVVRDQKNSFFEVHAGIYINDELSFSKYGESNLMSYSYGLQVQRVYGVTDSECLRVQGIPKPGEPCHNKPFTNYFQCKSGSAYVSQLLNEGGGIDERVRVIYADTYGLDIKVSDVAYKGKTITKETLQKYQADLESLYNQSRPLITDSSVNTRNQEFARLQHARLFSIFEQTRRIARSLGEKEMATKVLPNPVTAP